MSTILFLVDNTPSMYQTAYTSSGRMTFLDLAKRAIDMFVKRRQKIPEGRLDRYMLMTFDEPPDNMKVGWKDNLETFLRELSSLGAFSLGSLERNIKRAFDTLIVQRMATGIDNYGQGRYPSCLQPATIIVITEGRKISTPFGVQKDLTIPIIPLALGADLTKEAYRWDHRLYAIILRMPGTPENEQEFFFLLPDETNIENLCKETGGRSFAAKTSRILMRSIQYLATNIHQGFRCRLEENGPLSDEPMWNTMEKCIFLTRAPHQRTRVGLWPIPEAHWPDINMRSLPPRDAHPKIGFSKIMTPMLLKHFPTDEYIVQTGAFTHLLLTNSHEEEYSYYSIHVNNSFRYPPIVHSCGYFVADKRSAIVKLCLMPYNYPKLLLLLKTLFTVHERHPDEEWHNNLRTYLEFMPNYYIDPLRTCFRLIGIEEDFIKQVIPIQYHITSLSDEIIQYLGIEKSKAEIVIETIQSSLIKKRLDKETRKPITITSYVNKETAIPSYLANKVEFKFVDFTNIEIGVEGNSTPNKKLHLDIIETPREHLLEKIGALRSKFYHFDGGDSTDQKHNLPVSEMGNAKEYMGRITPPLRQVNPEQAYETSTLVRRNSSTNPNRGPIPRDIMYRRGSPIIRPPPPPPRSTDECLTLPRTLQYPGSFYQMNPRPVQRMPVASNWGSTERASTSSSQNTAPLSPIVSPQGCAGGKTAQEVSLSRIENWFKKIGLKTSKPTTEENIISRPGPSGLVYQKQFEVPATTSSTKEENKENISPSSNINERKVGKNGDTSSSSDEEDTAASSQVSVGSASEEEYFE